MLIKLIIFNISYLYFKWVNGKAPLEEAEMVAKAICRALLQAERDTFY
jgi:hypothetical protein